MPHDCDRFDMDWLDPQRVAQRDDHRHQITGWLAPVDALAFAKAYQHHLMRTPGALGAKSSIAKISSSSGSSSSIAPRFYPLPKVKVMQTFPKYTTPIVSGFEADHGGSGHASSSANQGFTCKSAGTKRSAHLEAEEDPKRTRVETNDEERSQENCGPYGPLLRLRPVRMIGLAHVCFIENTVCYWRRMLRGSVLLLAPLLPADVGTDE